MAPPIFSLSAVGCWLTWVYDGFPVCWPETSSGPSNPHVTSSLLALLTGYYIVARALCLRMKLDVSGTFLTTMRGAAGAHYDGQHSIEACGDGKVRAQAITVISHPFGVLWWVFRVAMAAPRPHVLFLLVALALWFVCGNGGISLPYAPPPLPPLSGAGAGAGAVNDTPVAAAVGTSAPLVALHTKYKSRFVCCQIPAYPDCDVYLCGTLHVAKTSTEMVQEVIRMLRPQFVVLELCESRVDSLQEVDLNEAANITLAGVIRMSVEERSAKVLGMGLLSWMQLKAAKIMGSRLGGELAMAAREGASMRSVVVLGDRLYGVTIQRIFDKLGLVEKLKMVMLLFWEVVTMSMFRLKEYVHKTETDDGFIHDEIARFRKYLPTFANVIVTERDEYLAQTLLEIASSMGSRHNQAAVAVAGTAAVPRGRIVAVVGAAHLAGVQRCLASGGCSEAHIAEISSSSKHKPTWAGRGMLQIVNTQSLGFGG